MNEEEDFSSDSSDEDYVPTGENADLSEEDDSGDDEDFQPVEDDQKEDKSHQISRGRKTAKKTVRSSNGVTSRKRKGGIKLADEDDAEAGVVRESESEARSSLLAEKVSSEHEAKGETAEKKRADDLWDSFMKDVSTARPKPVTSSTQSSKSDTVSLSVTPRVSASTSASKPESTPATVETKPDKMTIVKEYKFAGETIKMSTTVDVNSKEAKEHQIKSNVVSPATSLPSTTTSQPTGLKRPGSSGLSSILDRIDKRPKMSTLVKSKLDWDTFKSAEGIDEDLKIHNRGKDGYLERQAFLERTDHRQFEIERSLRLGANRK